MGTQRRVAIVGGGLSGLMAAMKLAEAGIKVLLFSVVPVKRSHSVCAQGGINGAVNLRGEGDSPYLHFEDTVMSADFLNHQPPVMRMAERAPALIYLLDRLGVPFNRTAEGHLSFRRFGGTLLHRTAYAGATTGQQLLYALDEQVRRYEVSHLVEKREAWEFLGIIKDEEGRCRGLVAQDLYTMEIESFPADAVVMASGGNGVIYGRSTNSIINTGAGASICYQQGATYGNPEMVQIHPTAIPGEDKCRLISESVRGEGGRLWVPRNPDDPRNPVDIPEAERWYFCEELDPVYGNLLSRDLVSFVIYCICHAGKGVKGKNQVYLDITHLSREKGMTREQINDKLEGVLEIYQKFMREDPIDNPMRIYPAVHYTMGGLWIDYEKGHQEAIDLKSHRNQMTTIPGLYAVGECDFQYHGANRLGANALLTCLVGGELAAFGIQAYLRSMENSWEKVNQTTLLDAKKHREDEYQNYKRSHGSENPYKLHDELANIMWYKCGIWRTQEGLLQAREQLADLTERVKKCNLLDNSDWSNQSVPFTRALHNMIEMSKAIVGGAITRDESRGAHFKINTPFRDDKHWLKSTLAHWTPEGPEFTFEPIDCSYMQPRERKYHINQITIVEQILGKDALGPNKGTS